MKNNNILLLGYSHIARKRIIDVFVKNKIVFSIASQSHKRIINGAKRQFSNYEDALKNSGANIVYISLPNALHFMWAKKALLMGYHVIIDKPFCYKFSETKELIKIAKKRKKLLSEAIFYNHHAQINKVIKLVGSKKNINKINVNFCIPMPERNSLLMSKKLKGGVIMDMGPYAASIHRIFFHKKIINMKIVVSKKSSNLPISFKIEVKYNKKIYSGSFKFGEDYINQVNFFTKNKEISIDRVFSPPSNINLSVKVLKNNKLKTYLVKKDNCFENYFLELLIKINKKNYSYYYKQIEEDHFFRNRIQKKFIKSLY
jgi:NDP-hexose-3-ketoreductase